MFKEERVLGLGSFKVWVFKGEGREGLGIFRVRKF